MKYGTCKLCGLTRPLVAAHIIPQSFYDFMRQGDPQPCRLFSTGEHPKRCPTGIYDEELVCKECEGLFSFLDDCGAKTLIPEFPASMCIKTPAGIPAVCQQPAYDYGKLRLFLLSVLWRMSATTRPEFDRISLGPHEARIAAMIRAKDAGSADEYGIVLARFTDLAGHYSLMMPRTTRIATGHRFCIFYLGGYMVRVKVDKRPMPSEVDPFLMRTNAPLYVVLDDSRNRREFAGVARLVVEAEKLRGCPPRH